MCEVEGECLQAIWIALAVPGSRVIPIALGQLPLTIVGKRKAKYC
jgi:hypothetical protein